MAINRGHGSIADALVKAAADKCKDLLDAAKSGYLGELKANIDGDNVNTCKDKEVSI